MKKADAAVVTMVRQDDFCLRIWFEYWSKFVPPEHIYIIVDGEQDMPAGTENCVVLTLPHAGAYSGYNQDRWLFLTHFASALTAKFGIVITNDVDEIIVLDPEAGHGNDPIAYVRDHSEAEVISPFALELVHRIDLEPDLDRTAPIMAQRKYGRINASYCKPCIIRKPVRWALGAHQADHPELTLSRDLFLFHLRFMDRNMLLERQARRNAFGTSNGGTLIPNASGPGWTKDLEEMQDFLESFVRFGPPKDGDFKFSHQRRKIEASWGYDENTGLYRHRTLHNRASYTIPERLCSAF